MKRRLKGMTWDHARGFDPLQKGVPLFVAEHPDYEIEWTRRSLRDFGVQPVEVLAEQYDLIVIDHPFCGRAKATNCLLDLKPLFPAAFFAMLEKESVGPSTRSYYYGGGIWGLPTDAASQVASYRPDLLKALGFDHPPKTWSEVLALGAAARKAGKWIGLPSVQSDAACLVATLSANLGKPISPDTDYLLLPDVFAEVLDYLDQLRPFCHPKSTERNPIHTYDAMAAGDEIVYVPFGFGYTNYSRAGVKVPIHYTTIAGPGEDPAAGAILGGAGAAISANCKDVEAAVAYLTWMHQPEHQAGAYYRNGGQ
ncbi:MAG: carbohydrate ABC transporter substrate-binding protein, partial [Rhizobiales bacterium]|nr:carbohydrate ABC transporter substrate-binding protein [Hyphomicrobiales bacterium]